MECCYKFLDKDEANDIQIVNVDKYIDIIADEDNLRFVDKIGIDLLKSDLLF